MSNITSIREELLAKREQIVADLEAIAKFNQETGDWEATPTTDTPEADVNNEADGVEDWNERHATVSQLEILFRNYNRALEKIENGTFGTCEVCGEVISTERLAIIKEARTCVTHIDDERTLPL